MDDKQIQNIFKNVLDGLKSKLDALDTRGQKFYKSLQSIQEKVNKHIKSNCARELDWFEKNGKVEDGEAGLGLSVNDDVDRAEAEKRLDNFKACARNNDYGLEDFFMKMQTQQESIEHTNSDCIQNCLAKKGKEEDQLRDCLTSCFSSTIVEMNKTFDGIEKKINEVNNKL
jgi:hypothetical protein